MSYEVIKAFNLFVYNDKKRSFKLKHYDVGDTIEESIKRRLRNPQCYLK